MLIGELSRRTGVHAHLLRLPCVTGTTPDLAPCPELLATMRARRDELDERIGTLARSRKLLHDYIDATERRAAEQHHDFIDATERRAAEQHHGSAAG